MTRSNSSLECPTCDTVVRQAEAIRRETIGGLDPEKWQTLCCAACGTRLKTVFVGSEDP